MKYGHFYEIFKHAIHTCAFSTILFFFPSFLNEKANELHASGYFVGNITDVCFFIFSEEHDNCEICYDNKMLETVIVYGVEVHLWISFFVANVAFASIIYLEKWFDSRSERTQKLFQDVSYYLIVIPMFVEQLVNCMLVLSLSAENEGKINLVFGLMFEDEHPLWNYHTMIVISVLIVGCCSIISIVIFMEIIRLKSEYDRHFFQLAAKRNKRIETTLRIKRRRRNNH